MYAYTSLDNVTVTAIRITSRSACPAIRSIVRLPFARAFALWRQQVPSTTTSAQRQSSNCHAWCDPSATRVGRAAPIGFRSTKWATRFEEIAAYRAIATVATRSQLRYFNAGGIVAYASAQGIGSRCGVSVCAGVLLLEAPVVTRLRYDT